MSQVKKGMQLSFHAQFTKLVITNTHVSLPNWFLLVMIIVNTHGNENSTEMSGSGTDMQGVFIVAHFI